MKERVYMAGIGRMTRSETAPSTHWRSQQKEREREAKRERSFDLFWLESTCPSVSHHLVSLYNKHRGCSHDSRSLPYKVFIHNIRVLFSSIKHILPVSSQSLADIHTPTTSQAISEIKVIQAKELDEITTNNDHFISRHFVQIDSNMCLV